jgi:hypothetical protein
MILNKTRKSRERYRIIEDGMGFYKDPKDSPNYKYRIVVGVNRGNGYQSAMSVEYFFKNENPPFLARVNAIQFLKDEGYEPWLKRKKIMPANLSCTK